MLFVIVKEGEPAKKTGIFSRRAKKCESDFERSGFEFNGKYHNVVKISPEMLESTEFQRLLSVFKGKCVVPKAYKLHPLFMEIAFDSEPYFCASELSSLVGFLIIKNDRGSAVCVKMNEKTNPNLLLDAVNYLKALTLVTQNNRFAESFCRECSEKYGFLPRVVSVVPAKPFDVFLDLSAKSEGGRRILVYKGVECVLYRDPSYFSVEKCPKSLLCEGFELTDLCAAVCS